MESTQFIGKDGTPVIVTGGGHGNYNGRDNRCVEELLLHKAISDGTRETANVGAVIGAAIERSSGDGKLNAAIIADRITEVVNRTGVTNLLAIKDTQNTVEKEGGRTREVLGAQINLLERETLKGFAESQYKALENKCALEAQAAANKAELAAQIAECCCEARADAAATRALILAENARKTEQEAQDLRMQLLILSGGILGGAKTAAKNA